MKLRYAVAATSVAAFLVVSCDTMTGPISSGSFDPLTPPGSNAGPQVVEPTSGIVPGQIAMVGLDNAAFFKRKPTGEGDADKLLKAGTQVKVVSTDGSYVKVELDNGEVGFMPAVMIDDPASVRSPNEVQIYPAPPPGGADVPIIPLDPADPNDPQAPATDKLPSVIEPEETPEMELPPVPDTPAPPPVPNDLESKPAE